jgi:5-methylthioadenosine/S-adenosylhomocysteine deaminase
MFQTTGTRPLCFVGDVVNEDGSVSRRQYVQLAGGRIQSVSAAKPAGVARPDYTLEDDELMFPSFLDLHTHSTYNMLPLWHSPYWAWDNRFQWRANAQYKQSIGAANRAIVSTSGDGTRTYDCFNAFSELMAIAGGTTVLQESADLDAAGFARQSHILIRNTGSALDLGMTGADQVVSVVDFYEPSPYTAPGEPYQDTSRWQPKQATKSSYDGSSYISDFALSITGTRTRGTIVHLAEGRSGYLQTVLGVDAYTRAEFEAFAHFISTSYRGADAAKVKDARLLLIHACGMDSVSAISFLKTYGIGVIWSPVSNLLLYQDTTNVMPLLDAGIPLALGTDWTPSGSKTVWEEAKFAIEFLEARRWKGNATLTCFKATTSGAADLLGLPLGRIKAGNFADLIVIRRPEGARRGDALQTFRGAGDQDVRVVVVGGVPLYGDQDLLKKLGTTPLPLPDESTPHAKHRRPGVASSKGFTLPAGCGVTMEDMTRALHAADHIVGRNRPQILAADDEDYQSRMSELREWVKEFGSKVRPTPKPVPKPPSGLAPGEQEWMYNPSLDPKNRLGADVVDLLGRIAPCRDEECAVPKRHPFYHSEVLAAAGDSYGFRTPCMPVVPVLTNRQQLFVMGDYPTAKFTARSTNALPIFTDSADSITSANRALASFLGAASAQPHGDARLLETYTEEIDDLIRGAVARPDIVESSRSRSYGAPEPARKNEFFVPVADVFAPMQDANYFDGYKVRNVASGVFLEDNFLTPVGVDTETQVWLSNMIKCFLFHGDNADAYQALGWTDVRVEQSYSELLPVGKVCSQWINEEVQVCDPKLVLTVGKPPCVLLHNLPFDDLGLQGRVYDVLLGVQLPANDSRLETAIASALELTSRYPPPFSKSMSRAPGGTPALGQSLVRAASRVKNAIAPAMAATAIASGTKSAPPPPPHPVAMTRVGPWAKYNVFHMMHPQAVMMAQTSASGGLLAAIQLTLGAKARGMSVDDLNDAIEKYLHTHSTSDLIKALPYGQRDTFTANARLLERHAVTMANLAETLLDLKLVTDPRFQPDRVLAQQASQLVTQFHLADSAAAELKKLKDLRAAQQSQLHAYLHPGKARR